MGEWHFKVWFGTKQASMHSLRSKIGPYALVYHPLVEKNECDIFYFQSKVNLTIKIKRKFIFRGLSFQQSSSQLQQFEINFILISMDQIYFSTENRMCHIHSPLPAGEI